MHRYESEGTGVCVVFDDSTIAWVTIGRQAVMQLGAAGVADEVLRLVGQGQAEARREQVPPPPRPRPIPGDPAREAGERLAELLAAQRRFLDEPPPETTSAAPTRLGHPRRAVAEVTPGGTVALLLIDEDWAASATAQSIGDHLTSLLTDVPRLPAEPSRGPAEAWDAELTEIRRLGRGRE